jgi:hypothetical protein
LTRVSAVPCRDLDASYRAGVVEVDGPELEDNVWQVIERPSTFR